MTVANQLERGTAIAQGAYFVVTGVWPMLSLRTFELVTGPKVDGWLVKTVGLLVTAVGGPLLFGACSGRLPLELRLVAVGSATGLALVDIMYVQRRRIAPVYLLDALAQAVFLAGWCAGWVRTRAS
jgi:hypothetical protein